MFANTVPISMPRQSWSLAAPGAAYGYTAPIPVSYRSPSLAAAPASDPPSIPPSPSGVSFETLIEVFDAEYLPMLKPRAALRYRVSIKALRAAFGGLLITEITKARIWDFITLRRRAVMTPTIRRDLACLSSMFEQAKTRDWLAINVVRDLDLRHVRESKPRTRYLSKEEEARLIAAAAPYLQPMIVFAIETGFRLSEQMTLEWGQINLERREVTLIKTKTDSPRVVPLTERALAVLAAQPHHPTSPFVFCKADGSRFLNLKKGFKGAMRRSGISDLRWHDLRRTCGCRLLQEYKADLYLVRKWLGHKSVTMTERAYAFLRIDDLHAVIGKPRFLGGDGEEGGA